MVTFQAIISAKMTTHLRHKSKYVILKLLAWIFVQQPLGLNRHPLSKCMVECLLMIRWVVGLIPLGGPTSYFSLQPHDWCNKGCGMCYPVCGMVHIKEPLMLIRESSPCGCSGFLLAISVVLYHIIITINVLSASLNIAFPSFPSPWCIPSHGE